MSRRIRAASETGAASGDNLLVTATRASAVSELTMLATDAADRARSLKARAYRILPLVAQWFCAAPRASLSRGSHGRPSSTSHVADFVARLLVTNATAAA